MSSSATQAPSPRAGAHNGPGTEKDENARPTIVTGYPSDHAVGDADACAARHRNVLRFCHPKTIRPGSLGVPSVAVILRCSVVGPKRYPSDACHSSLRFTVGDELGLVRKVVATLENLSYLFPQCWALGFQ